MKSSDTETYRIIGCAMKAHTQLGHGFLEAVYQEALEVELLKAKIPYKRECELPIYYDGIAMNIRYRVDFICFDNTIVELKALEKLTPAHDSQVLNYLKASKIKKGLLLNFGSKSLQQ